MRRKANIAKTDKNLGARTLKDALGKNVRDKRERIGITQAALAKACGVKQSTISDIERGRRWPSHTLLKDIAQTLDTPAALLLAE